MTPQWLSFVLVSMLAFAACPSTPARKQVDLSSLRVVAVEVTRGNHTLAEKHRSTTTTSLDLTTRVELAERLQRGTRVNGVISLGEYLRASVSDDVETLRRVAKALEPRELGEGGSTTSITFVMSNGERPGFFDDRRVVLTGVWKDELEPLLRAEGVVTVDGLPVPPPPLPREPEREVAYAEVLRLVKQFKAGELTWAQLEKQLVARKLPPHGLGCGYLLMVPPPPPPGVVFDPTSMPGDWSGTWGEVAMTMFAGPLTREEYDRLHRAAHGREPGFPNCKR